MQEKYKAGERVRHEIKTEWGIGEVLANEAGGRVKVFFENDGAIDFEIAKAKFVRLSGEEAKSDFLDTMIAQYKLEASRPVKAGKIGAAPMSRKGAIEKFLKHFPLGFTDPQYVTGKNNEREYKDDASSLMQESLSKDALLKLIEKGEFLEVVNRAQKVLNKTDHVSLFEKFAFRNGLAPIESHKPFANALFDFLYGERELRERFADYCACLSSVGAASWPLATFHLFMRFPEKYIFLKPLVTQYAAKVFGVLIDYQPEVKWITYRRALELAEQIRKELIKDGRATLAPKDMIDIQSFIWIIGPGYH